MWTTKVPATLLSKLGFRQIELSPFDGRNYEVWKRDKFKKRKGK